MPTSSGTSAEPADQHGVGAVVEPFDAARRAGHQRVGLGRRPALTVNFGVMFQRSRM